MNDLGLVQPVDRLGQRVVVAVTPGAHRRLDAGDRAAVSRAFRLAERYLLLGNARMRNAIAVSYVEDLNFEEGESTRRWAWSNFPSH
ncbi:DUF7674 family protein [Caldimonas manganoxidans]|uniref:DUF7674 family protein n=1 Tax=Caldimonas manganoxidans TaxID=196015 RepID=UPI004046E8F4